MFKEPAVKDGFPVVPKPVSPEELFGRTGKRQEVPGFSKIIVIDYICLFNR